MGWLQDWLKEVPLSAVMQQRVTLAEERFAKVEAEAEELRRKVAELEKENRKLKDAIPKQRPLSNEQNRILVLMFEKNSGKCSDSYLRNELDIIPNMLRYHIETLQELLLVRRADEYFDSHDVWELTAKGRRYVVENGLLG